QTVLLEISDDVKDTVLSFLHTFPSDAVKIFEYDDTTFTPEDEIDYQTRRSLKKKQVRLFLVPKLQLGNAYPQALLDVVCYERKDKSVLFIDTPSGA
ncbi:MAG: hypothetical protein QX189_10240, partial [Methylococcales bacterium]